MKPIEKVVRNSVEKIEEFKPKPTKARLKYLERESKAKNMTTLIASRLTLLRKDYKHMMDEKMFTPRDVILLLEMLSGKNREFKDIEKFSIGRWKGKSGLKFQEKPDSVLVYRHQKEEKDGKPELKVGEIQKVDINRMIQAINFLWSKVKYKLRGIPTRDIAEITWGKDWETYIYSHRDLHIETTYILNWLEEKGMIKYSRKGFTRVINYTENLNSLLEKEVQKEL